MKKITKVLFVFLFLFFNCVLAMDTEKTPDIDIDNILENSKDINPLDTQKKRIIKAPKININFQNISLNKVKSKVKSKIKKKPKPIFPKIPETKEEWLEKSQNVPLEERKLDKYEYPQGDKKVFIPNPSYRFERYNYPQGKREINIQDIKKDLMVTSYLVADNECKKAAYAKYYFSPDINQISSEFFVEDLDTLKTRKNRILQYNHSQKKRIPIISVGTDMGYKDLFQTLTLVDWDKSGKKLIIKEKTGSMYGGIYQTLIYIHFVGDDNKEGYTIKLVDLNETIKNYFSSYENFQIINYRYNIEPIGFDGEDENIVLLYCIAYTKDNQKVFLGIWGYDCITGDVMLLSKEKDSNINASANGLFLKQIVN